jgi:TIR domain
MDPQSNRVFISYRRDDAAGYAGRVEEALERRLGRGSVFRDVFDIPPGEDFISAIRAHLAGARSVLVLIGPRWAGSDAQGRRRIDDERDFVRLEVAVALDSGARVVPVLLPGADMPAEDSLPAALKPLARRNAMTLGETHWQADIDRLIDSLGLSPRRSVWPRAALGAAVLAGALVGGWWLWQPAAPPVPVPAPAAASVRTPELSEQMIGTWKADLRYEWGDRYHERFEFKRHAGQLTGTASFLGYPRAIENLQLDGNNLHFQTRSNATLGESTREVIRSYAAELHSDASGELLAFRMQSSGGHSSEKPLEFEARRLAPGDSQAATRDSRPASAKP